MHVKTSLAETLPHAAQVEPGRLKALATNLSATIWDVTPLPSHGFQSSPLPKPGRNDPCSCGSRIKYKRCCARFAADTPALTTEELWPLVSDVLSVEQLKRAGASANVPAQVRCDLAKRCLSLDQPKRALALVEPIFDQPPDRLARLGARYEDAFDVLIDTYDRLQYRHKKEQALERLTKELRPPLRAAVWMRRASIKADSGDWDLAWECFANAQRDDPDHPALSSLEVTMLLSCDEPDRAQARARFWLARFERAGLDDEGGPAGLMREVIAAPYRTTFLNTSTWPEEQVLARFWDLVQREVALPVPRYEVEVTPLGSVLTAPTQQARLEEGWRNLPWPRDETTILALQYWFPSVVETWLDYLEETPGGLGSLTILRDVTLAALELPSSGARWHTRGVLLPLLKRGRAIITGAWSRAGESSSLPPLADLDSSEAALLLLELGIENPNEESESGDDSLISVLLELDPADRSGVRPILVAQKLCDGAYTEALAIIHTVDGSRRFFSLEFSEALAHFALGDTKAARRALEPAYRDAPLIADFLTGRKKKKPKSSYGPLSESMLAWLECEELKESWRSVPGAIEWLRKTRGKIDAAGRKAARERSRSRGVTGRVASGICRLRIELLDIAPVIWRRIELPYASSFWDLHVAVQNAMGWTDSHLHGFFVQSPETGEEVEIGMPDEDVECLPGWEQPIADFLTFDQPSITYQYDFGDNWQHEISLEAIVPSEADEGYPRCTGGERACPPEDVGSTPGYLELVAAMADERHPEREMLLEWLGGKPFEPERFDPAGVRFEDPGERWREVFRRDAW